MAVNYDADRPLPENAQKDVDDLVNQAGSLLACLRSFSSGSPAFSPTTIFNSVAVTLSRSYAEVRTLFSTLEFLSDLRINYGGAEDVISLLERRLSPERAQNAATNRANIRDLLDLFGGDHPVAISMKAEKLSFLHEHLFQDAEIITDSRSVFDTAGTKVLEMIVSHSLVLNHYSFGSGSKRMHFAMDATDVVRLKEVCERAILKAATLRTVLERAMVPTKVLNERQKNV